MVKMLYFTPQPPQCQPEGQQDVTLPLSAVRPCHREIEPDIELALEFLVALTMYNAVIDI